MVRVFAAICMFMLLLTGCTKDAPRAEEPIATKSTDGQRAIDQSAVPSPAPVPGAPLPADTCIVLDKLPQDPPVYIPGKNVVLTHLMQPCVTRDGRRGYAEQTPWLAMGFPCTGPGGRLDLKGNHYTNPKMVSLVLTTDCGMDPASRDTVKQLVETTFGLPPKAKLMAFTPFVVQFWELPGMTDADTGFTVELRSSAALGGAWKRLRDGDNLKVWLYGRENSWVQGNQFYQVEGQMKLDGKYGFRLTIDNVKVMTRAQMDAVKTRCEALRPARNCGEVF